MSFLHTPTLNPMPLASRFTLNQQAGRLSIVQTAHKDDWAQLCASLSRIRDDHRPLTWNIREPRR